ncbi:hypothetical protein, partial [Lentilactobacillus kefiri]|uniref:hypothetical protein n=1 Tax=Lentilactobacillus kefiri TaxID=33962 RepID=UPI0024685D32
STQVQSVSDAKSTVKVNSANSVSSNTVSDVTANKHSTSADDSKTTKNSDSTITTTYGDAKDNQVTVNDSSSKTDKTDKVTVNDSSAAKDDSSSNAAAGGSVGAQAPQQSSSQQGDAVDSSSAASTSSSSSSSSSSDSSSASSSTGSTDLNVGASVVGANDDTLNKVVKDVVDKVTDSDSDKSSTVDESTTTPAVPADPADDNVVVLESPDASEPGETQETLIVPNQPIIESKNIHNDILGDTFADKVTKSDPKAVKAAATSASSNKTKLLPFNAFSNKIYRHVLSTAQKPGTVTTTTGKKVTLTTPVKHVKYMEHDSTGISETLPLLGALAIIAVAGVTFIAFDPLRFLFK